MQRLLIVLLAAVDALVAAAIGLVVLLAPLTLIWAISFGASADWGALWPSAVTLWQFGHGVPVAVSLPDALVRAVGIAPEAARFVLSVPPLLLLAFTAFFAARSGRRAALSGSWITGVVSGTVVFAVISGLAALTGRFAMLATPLPLAILFPPLVFLCGALAGAMATAWSEGDGGIIDRIQDALDGLSHWAHVPGDIVRGASAALAGVIGAAGLAVAVAALVRGGQVVALFESLRADALGVVVIGLAQLAYLPTLLAWGIAWIAGPGFAIGTGTAVSPAGTVLGVVPGAPMLGLVPDNSSPWFLIVVLVPIAAGAFAGWLIRSRQVSAGIESGVMPRLAIALGIAVLAAAGGALLAALSSGSLGPGRLVHAGPEAGPVALALGLEVLVGAGILLLSPRRHGAPDGIWAEGESF
ncbi:cell division protein PerM [Microbacterium panaciterrae]|uniref:Integral membrane protein n=1 Tax=Microbacterium panaciterrae TaxID=985759 RepID=A0ABP8P2T7_9MICO